MGEDEKTSLTRAEFWQRAAALAFGTWAIVLPIAAGLVISSVAKFSEKFDAYILAMERRVTLLEERQQRVLGILQDVDNRLDNIENGRRQPR